MLKEQIRRRVKRRRDVLTRSEFTDLGSYRNIGRALAALVDEGYLVKVGQGRYCRQHPAQGAVSSPTLHAAFRRQVLSSDRLVFLRRDFDCAASPEAVRKALLRLQKEGVLVRIGQGLYAQARRSPLSGRFIPQGGLSDVVRGVASRLGREVLEDPATRRYNAGLSEQVPTGRYVELSGKPLRRKLTFGRGAGVQLVAHG